jgi:WD40 repeat protein
VTSVVYSPDGKRLVTGAGGQGPSSLGEVKVWDAETGQELLTLDGRSGPSSDVAFSPDGHRLVGIGRDGSLRIWDATPLPDQPPQPVRQLTKSGNVSETVDPQGIDNGQSLGASRSVWTSSKQATGCQ